MLPGLSGNTRLLAAFAFVSAILLAVTPSPLSAGPAVLHSIADDDTYDDGGGAGSDSDADRPAQRAPETDEPSEDGTDGATGGNSAEPPAGCLFRDGPLELVV